MAPKNVTEELPGLAQTFTFEIFDCFDFELQRGVLVADEHGVGVLLEGRHCPHVVDTVLDGFVQSKGFVGSRDQDHHLQPQTHTGLVRES